MEKYNVFIHDEFGKEITTLHLTSAPELHEIIKTENNFYEIIKKVRITHPKCPIEDFSVMVKKLPGNPICDTRSEKQKQCDVIIDEELNRRINFEQYKKNVGFRDITYEVLIEENNKVKQKINKSCKVSDVVINGKVSVTITVPNEYSINSFEDPWYIVYCVLIGNLYLENPENLTPFF